MKVFRENPSADRFVHPLQTDQNTEDRFICWKKSNFNENLFTEILGHEGGIASLPMNYSLEEKYWSIDEIHLKRIIIYFDQVFPTIPVAPLSDHL